MAKIIRAHACRLCGKTVLARSRLRCTTRWHGDVAIYIGDQVYWIPLRHSNYKSQRGIMFGFLNHFQAGYCWSPSRTAEKCPVCGIRLVGLARAIAHAIDMPLDEDEHRAVSAFYYLGEHHG